MWNSLNFVISCWLVLFYLTIIESIWFIAILEIIVYSGVIP